MPAKSPFVLNHAVSEWQVEYMKISMSQVEMLTIQSHLSQI